MSWEGYSQEDSFHLWCLKERSEGTSTCSFIFIFCHRSIHYSILRSTLVLLFYILSCCWMNLAHSTLHSCIPLLMSACLTVCLSAFSSSFLYIFNAYFFCNPLSPFTHLFSSSPYLICFSFTHSSLSSPPPTQFLFFIVDFSKYDFYWEFHREEIRNAEKEKKEEEEKQKLLAPGKLL